MKITLTLNDQAARRALAQARSVVEKHVELALDIEGIEVADEMRQAAKQHDVFQVLSSSIEVQSVAPLSRFITPTARYAKSVEEGTGPAAGKARYYPNPDNLLQFLRGSPKARGFNWANKLSKKRSSQDLELWFRSRAMAWAIYNKGTKAYPFVAQTAVKMEGRVLSLLRFGVEAGVREVFG